MCKALSEVVRNECFTPFDEMKFSIVSFSKKKKNQQIKGNAILYCIFFKKKKKNINKSRVMHQIVQICPIQAWAQPLTMYIFLNLTED